MFKILGKSDEQTTCDACGKSNLKATVVLESESTGIVRYGVDCASRALKGNAKHANKKQIEHQSNAIQFARENIAQFGVITPRLATEIFNRFGYCAEVRGDTLLIQIEREAHKWWTNAVITKNGIEYRTNHVASY